MGTSPHDVVKIVNLIPSRVHVHIDVDIPPCFFGVRGRFSHGVFHIFLEAQLTEIRERHENIGQCG